MAAAVVAVDPLDVSGGGEHVGGLPRSVDHGFEEVDGAGDPVVDDGAGAAEETLQAAVEEVDACPPVGGGGRRAVSCPLLRRWGRRRPAIEAKPR